MRTTEEGQAYIVGYYFDGENDDGKQEVVTFVDADRNEIAIHVHERSVYLSYDDFKTVAKWLEEKQKEYDG